MKSALGVVLPVRNAELELSRVVLDALDVLSDLTSQFELLIVDDASHDQTAEVADELMRQFPQIRVVTHPKRVGLVESARRGARLVRGDGVYILSGRLPVDAAGLRRAWQDLITSRSDRCSTPSGRPLPRRWWKWGVLHRQAWGSGGRRIPREALAVGETHGDRGEFGGRPSLASGGVPPTPIGCDRPDTTWELSTSAQIPLRRSRRGMAGRRNIFVRS